jgi:hypothetical protein
MRRDDSAEDARRDEDHMGRQARLAALTGRGRPYLSCPGFSFKHCYLNLIRKGGEVASAPIKHLTLGFAGREIADQGAFGRIFPKLFDLGQVILHGQTPCRFRPSSVQEQMESMLRKNKR